MDEIEAEAGERAARFLALVEAGARDELVQFTRTLTPDEVVHALLAIAVGLLGQEAANDVLAERVQMLEKSHATLDIANAQLFGDRKKLMARVDELQSIRSKQAERLGELRERVKAA